MKNWESIEHSVQQGKLSPIWTSSFNKLQIIEQKTSWQLLIDTLVIFIVSAKSAGFVHIQKCGV